MLNILNILLGAGKLYPYRGPNRALSLVFMLSVTRDSAPADGAKVLCLQTEASEPARDNRSRQERDENIKCSLSTM
jgi:hypothetical protein